MNPCDQGMENLSLWCLWSWRFNDHKVPFHRLLLQPEDYRPVQPEGQLHHLLWETGGSSQNLSKWRHCPHAQNEGSDWTVHYSDHVLLQNQVYVDMIPHLLTQTQFFNNAITLVNTFGFSVVTFDGTVGGDVEPRTSSRSFYFDQEVRRTVEELRSWAANEGLLPPVPSIPLCDVQPKAYFNLTCQLLAKAPIDSTCTLLRVRTNGATFSLDKISKSLQVVTKPNGP